MAIWQNGRGKMPTRNERGLRKAIISVHIERPRTFQNIKSVPSLLLLDIHQSKIINKLLLNIRSSSNISSLTEYKKKNLYR